MRLLLALLLVGMWSGNVRADMEEAKAHYKKGISAYALGRFKEAAQEYEAAFDLEPDPALLYNAAQAHRIAGDKERALLLYENYLRLFPDRPNEKEVRRHIVALKTAIEGDARAKSSPPVAPLPPKNNSVTAPVVPSPAPEVTAPPPAPAPVNGNLVTSAPPPKKKTPGWVWGVVGGVAGAVVIGVAVGLAVGLSGTNYPHPSSGTVSFQ